MPKTRLFHIGPQKTATTWIYECLKNHPDIVTSAKDTIHYYDMNFGKGRSWYDDQFIDNKKTTNPCYFDPTTTYIRSHVAAKNIHNDFPNAKIIFNLRHPIDRAFSHYWHERKKKSHTYSFEDTLKNYDLFASLVSPGLYAQSISPYIELFGVENILPLKMDEISKQPNQVLQKIYAHAKIDNSYKPEKANRRINAAGAKQRFINRACFKIGNIITDGKAADHPTWRKLGGIEEQSDIITKDMYDDLMALFLPDIEETEKLFEISLSEWK